MHSTFIFTLALACLTLALANPLKRQDTCVCTSPTGCPGGCGTVEGIGAACSNYDFCDNAPPVACGACEGHTGNCGVDSQGACFLALVVNVDAIGMVDWDSMMDVTDTILR
ncbi:hypothetical protein OE88DRAFT_1740447 [Heliocybe sulcata]|uniref:Uncharacterized protein n=1 Tax=Heliocybe sulcata TaxID=5364 RepID=A0A5C3MKQ3_9AGAM|nr:hypothetical protein OE88DRAFT_1740447 [Heliocybe sulcata]